MPYSGSNYLASQPASVNSAGLPKIPLSAPSSISKFQVQWSRGEYFTTQRATTE